MRSEALWLALGRGGNVLLSLLALRMMTTLLVPAEYAVLAILTAFQSFAGLILINPVGQYLNRYTHEWHDEGTLNARLVALSRYWLVAGAVTGLFAIGWFALVGQSDYAILLMTGLGVGLTIFAMTQQGVAVNRLNMLGFRQQSVLWQLTATAMGLSFSSLLTYVYPLALAWLVGQGAGAWLGYLGARRSFPQNVRAAQPDGATDLKEIVSRADFKAFCLPLALTTAFFWLEGNGYRFILERAWQPELFAFFMLGMSLPAQMSALLESFVMQLVYPYFFRAVAGRVGDERKQLAVASMVNALWPTYVLWSALVLLVAPYALAIVADPKYHAAARWLWVGVLAELARLTGNAWQMTAQVEKDFGPLRKPFALGALGTFGAAACTAWLGLSPSAFAMLIVTALMLKAMWIVRAMYVRMPFLIAYRRMMLAAGVLILMSSIAPVLPSAANALEASTYMALASVCAAIPLGLHVKTSPAFKHLFSYSLRGAS